MKITAKRNQELREVLKIFVVRQLRRPCRFAGSFCSLTVVPTSASFGTLSRGTGGRISGPAATAFFANSDEESVSAPFPDLQRLHFLGT